MPLHNDLLQPSLLNYKVFLISLNSRRRCILIPLKERCFSCLFQKVFKLFISKSVLAVLLSVCGEGSEFLALLSCLQSNGIYVIPKANAVLRHTRCTCLKLGIRTVLISHSLELILVGKLFSTSET